VNFNPDGSAAGRTDYMQGSQVDFAASDPPFRDGEDELAGTGAEDPSYGYSYVPDVGGGTAFMYHITLRGQLVTNLRLSGKTLMEIFTGQITNWDNPAITQDYGEQLPNEPIIPVIRSDGSGATYFFTRWMAHEFPSQWNAFCEQVKPGIKLPCPQTEFYPQFGDARAENGSNNVSTYITSSYGEGAIGYDEYAYALNAHWPVVAMENAAGYDVLPSASNVAVALTQAQINEDPNSINYLQQDLDNVYTYTDPRSYPLSSYSYLIVPKKGTNIPPVFSDAVGKSLSTFINYYLCAGQQQAGALGYSPLPINLVT
jgi:ABC-type phosphate transport system substrate-binding protein